GMYTVPEFMAPAVFGLTDEDTLPPADYCARILGAVCAAAVEAYADGGGLLVNYRDLPEAVEHIAAHFNLPRGADATRRMAARASFDAKNAGVVFTGMSATKRAVLDDALRATAERHVGAAYRALERAAASSPP